MSATNFTKGVNMANKLGQNRQGSVLAKPVHRSYTIPIKFDEGTSENILDKSFELPAKAIVKAAYVNVRVAEATGGTKTVDVGTDSTASGDADGFLNGVDVSSTGLKKGTLLNTGQTLGALLSVDEDGLGTLVPEADITSGGKAISWTPGSADFAELEADIIIEFIEIA